MKRFTRLSAAMLLALTLASPLAAKNYDWGFETRAVKDSPTVALDPAKGYILLQTPGALPATFFKVPTEAERAKSDELRAEELAKLQEKYAKKLAQYEREVKAYQPRPGVTAPQKPVEPSLGAIGWPAVEQRFMVMVGPFNRFAKEKGNSLYLQEVPPGEYVYYGSINPALGVGACACMGTVKFRVEAGKVAALRYDGVFLDKDGKALTRTERPQGQEMADTMVRTAMVIEPATQSASDPRIAASLVPARFEPLAFVPNWYGAEVNRLWPIAGVFDYRRSEQVAASE